MLLQDKIEGLRQQVAKLQAMATRNSNDKLVMSQVHAITACLLEQTQIYKLIPRVTHVCTAESISGCCWSASHKVLCHLVQHQAQ